MKYEQHTKNQSERLENVGIRALYHMKKQKQITKEEQPRSPYPPLVWLKHLLFPLIHQLTCLNIT